MCIPIIVSTCKMNPFLVIGGWCYKIVRIKCPLPVPYTIAVYGWVVIGYCVYHFLLLLSYCIIIFLSAKSEY